MSDSKKKNSDLLTNIWTVPNILTMIRIILVPIFAVLFLKGSYIPALVVLLLSGLTDFFDGKIARRFNQISELGKILDPIADKFTQITIAVLLFFKFRTASDASLKAFSWVFLLFLVKEASMLIGGSIMLSKGIRPGASELPGKIATFFFYGAMLVILGFGPEIGAFTKSNPDFAISSTVAMVLVVISAILTFVALFSYFPGLFKQIKEYRESQKTDLN